MTGKSTDPASYTCQIAGQTCTISSIDSSTNTVYVEVPRYNNANVNFGVLTQDPNDTYAQINPFVGSNGFKYSRYSLDLTKTLSDWVNYFRAGSITLGVLQS